MSAAGSGHVEVVKYAFELDPGVVKETTSTTGNNAVHMSVTGTGGLGAAEVDLRGDSIPFG